MEECIKMKVNVFGTVEEASKEALKVFQNELNNGAEVFGLATGSTPEKLYDLMKDTDIDFSNSISINLDEYYGLDKDHPQSYNYFMNDNLFQYKPFKKSYLPNGVAENPDEEVKRYNEIIDENPIDLQLLGIGPNGHIGFNEPGASRDSKTQLVDLEESTIDANQRFFDSIDDVPKKAYSMGLSSIMDSKKIILLAFGEGKAWAVKNMIEGPVTSDVPASILQEHDDVVVILDEDAASKLEEK